MTTVLVTGASRGIGLEFVRQYAADGWNVIATYRDSAKAEALQNLVEGNQKIRIEALDVTDDKAITALAERLKDISIDVLINNAGVPPSGQPSSPDVDSYNNPQWSYGGLDAAQYLNVMKVNAVAPIIVSQAFTPHVLRSAQKKIIMISSRQGSIKLNPLPGLFAYGASKAALNMAMRKMATVLQPQQVTVASFHPGWVRTDMGGESAEITPEVSVSGMRKIIAGLKLKNTGQFMWYNGKTLPW